MNIDFLITEKSDCIVLKPQSNRALDFLEKHKPDGIELKEWKLQKEYAKDFLTAFSEQHLSYYYTYD